MIHLEHDFNGKTVHYSTSADYLFPDYIKSRKALFYLSMKNRSFSKELISWFLLYSKHMKWQVEVCVVDKPYYAFFEWKRWKHGINNVDEIDLLNKVSFEIKRKLKKVISAEKDINVHILEWDSLRSQCPDWIIVELREAFGKNRRVHKLLSEQTKNIIGKLVDCDDLVGKFEFVLDEIPVLTWAYYSGQNSVVDIYPSENTPFFTELEQGALISELPLTSRMVTESPQLIYGNIKST